MTTVAHPRDTRPYDPADISSRAFWSQTAAEREKTYAVLRAERPVSWHQPVEDMLMKDPNDQGFWAVVRHADLVEVTKRHEDFISGEGIVMESMPQELLDAGQGFIAMDPPRHTKIRRLLSSAFTPKQIRRIHDQIQANAGRIVDDIATRGEVDFVPEVAALVPMHNICDMMGIDEADRTKMAYEAQFAGGWNDPELMGDQEPLGRLFEAMLYLGELAGRYIAERRRNPGEDLLSNLVQAEVDGERLTDDEIMSFFGLLTIAGNDTTRQSTSHAMKALTDFPEQKAWLMEDLDGRLKGAVEEMVRWATPIMTFRRTASRDCELNGQQITHGDKVVMFYASANWDTEVFDAPERFDLSRNPNPHVSFGGGGIHHCLGNQLARQQLAAIYRELLTRLPDIEVSGEPSYTVSTFFHGVNHLPVRFTPER
ncbi:MULTISPECIES: cytochrome P450 [Blastococcus]|jgi:cytochrome P450|uniref:Cytochrome P450 n=2 Tax=Blastococcus TaxID=38501 RepID=A0A6L9W214_9ACTN|nr:MULTISPECIES: cytochrome P450 [Blastococcus]MCF6735937.1 cytochrome P450 [Blastococcus sp. KM273129]NEK86018.1 cytochrome P450 [Blastococcus saxobsidens]